MKMDLKGLTPHSFREGESSIFHIFLSPEKQIVLKMNNTMAIHKTNREIIGIIEEDEEDIYNENKAKKNKGKRIV